jgi:hypothetical protein
VSAAGAFQDGPAPALIRTDRPGLRETDRRPVVVAAFCRVRFAGQGAPEEITLVRFWQRSLVHGQPEKLLHLVNRRLEQEGPGAQNFRVGGREFAASGLPCAYPRRKEIRAAAIGNAGYTVKQGQIRRWSWRTTAWRWSSSVYVGTRNVL